MFGKKSGFIGQLIKECLHSIVLYSKWHCTLNEPALYGQSSSHNIVNRIRAGHNSVTHRKLKIFLKENENGNLVMHTQVRWLSTEKCLDKFFDLRNEVTQLMKIEKHLGDC